MTLSSRNDRRDHASLFGTAAVAWMLAASKWGSHIPIGPFFVADALIGFAAAYALASYSLKPARQLRPSSELTPRPHWALVLLLGWAILRLAFSEIDFGMTALRDFAPYAYVLVGVISGVAAYFSTARSRARTCQVLWWALIFHLAWVALVRLLPSVRGMMPAVPGEQMQMFQSRGDIDMAILGVTAAVALYRWLDRRGAYYLFIGCIAIAVALLIPSRAGLIGAILPVAFVLVLSLGNKRHFGRSVLIGTAIPLVAIAALFALAQTPAVNRVLATFDPTVATDERASAQGTTEAREQAWQVLINYTMGDDVRAIAGVGFGPDVMLDSDAAYALLGAEGVDDGVRSPHNYWIGTLARMGIIGAALAITVALATCARIVRIRQYLGLSELHLIAAAIVLAFLPTATFGVTLESPFGAIPYYWAAGIILGVRVRSQSVEAPKPDLARAGNPSLALPAGGAAWRQ
ncbi:O-antigen ligase family protein [Mycolicibacterium iranicum]|uniref:O-antigen ligase family protein n=1 Tax=Mycolicibacterium iranicum TaxID=912594 RepID=UPI000A15B4C0|nr:O-antigen ligase family protein [Mycolicibacterium iranicum]